MQLVKFDSAEVESRHEKLIEYTYHIKNSIQELDGNLQSLIYDTQKVIDDLCYSSSVRTSDDGALGKINYVLTQMPQSIAHTNGILARVKGTLAYWQNFENKLRIDIEVLDSEIRLWADKVDILDSRLKSLREPYEYTYTETDDDGYTHTYTETDDPDAEERHSLYKQMNQIYDEHIKPLSKKREELHKKWVIAKNNCAIAQKDINKLDALISRCNTILSTAKKDDAHIKKTLKALTEIIDSLKKYREKLEKYNNSAFELIGKAEKIFGKALSAIEELKFVSHKYISDFKNGPIQVKFDIDECKKYKVNGDDFNDEIENLSKYIVNNVTNLSEWNDSNKNSVNMTILGHANIIKGIKKFFDNEMDFLKKQISILTDYYNSVS